MSFLRNHILAFTPFFQSLLAAKHATANRHRNIIPEYLYLTELVNVELPPLRMRGLRGILQPIHSSVPILISVVAAHCVVFSISVLHCSHRNIRNIPYLSFSKTDLCLVLANSHCSRDGIASGESRLPYARY